MDKLIKDLKLRIQDPARYISFAEQVHQAEKLLGKGKYGYDSTIPSPATFEEIDNAEKELGFKLPSLLRDLYTQVANGGFGPGYGLLGVPPNGKTDDQGENILTLDLAVGDLEDLDELYWPDCLLPFCSFGSVYACLDCSQENGKIQIWDAGELTEEPGAPTLRIWLEDWLNSEAR